MIKRISLIWLLLFGAFAGMAQTLTCTFQFTGSGTLGTHTFTNSGITITTTSNTVTPHWASPTFPMNTVDNTSASVTIAAIGTFPFSVPTSVFESTTPLNSGPGPTTVENISFGAPGNYYMVTYVNTTATSLWNMVSSAGPITSSMGMITGWAGTSMGTSGGTLSIYSANPTPVTFHSTFVGTPPTPTLTRTGVLSHIAAGGDWTTVMTLVNTSAAAGPVTVALHSDDVSALTLPVTTTQQGISQKTTASSVSTTINPNATWLISTGDQVASTVVGWADVLSTESLGGYAIFRSTPQTGSPSEGTVPLQIQFPSTVTLAYDNTAGFVMGVALANLSTSLASVTVTMWDDIGNQLGTQFISIAGNGHTAFVLPNQFPLTVGKRGIVKFQATGGLTGLGLRFSPFGTFTSVPTM